MAQPSTLSGQQQYISFLLDRNLQMMVPTGSLAETINLEISQIVQIPDLPPSIVGVYAWRGEVLWLVDLAYHFGKSALLNPDYRHSKCTVLRVLHQGESLGLLIQEVKQVIRCTPDQLRPGSPPGLASQHQDCFQGHLIQDKTPMFLLDLGAVLATLH